MSNKYHLLMLSSLGLITPVLSGLGLITLTYLLILFYVLSLTQVKSLSEHIAG